MGLESLKHGDCHRKRERDRYYRVFQRSPFSPGARRAARRSMRGKKDADTTFPPLPGDHWPTTQESMTEQASSSSKSTTPTTPGNASDKVNEPTSTDTTTDDKQDPSTSTTTGTTAGDGSGNGEVPTTPKSGTYAAGDWQAIWSPAHNAYYFHNSTTRETTWVNPLQQGQQQQAVEGSNGKGKEKATGDENANEDDKTEGQDEGDEDDQGNAAGPSTTSATTGTVPTTTTPALSQWEQMQANAIAQGIDPSLAHLDPSLAAGPSLPSGAFTARFNAKTGAFTATDGRDPSHLSEYERAKRMSQFYFDVGAWEEELEQRDDAEEEKKKKRKPSKKDLVSSVPSRFV
jgi:hypothetical protein